LAAGFVEFRLAENSGSFLSVGALFPDSVRFAVFTFGIGAATASPRNQAIDSVTGQVNLKA